MLVPACELWQVIDNPIMTLARTSIDVRQFLKDIRILISSGKHTLFETQAENSGEKLILTADPRAYFVRLYFDRCTISTRLIYPI